MAIKSVRLVQSFNAIVRTMAKQLMKYPHAAGGITGGKVQNTVFNFN
jgi:hypothetical protein